MLQLGRVNDNIEQLNGHVQLVRQGTQSAIAAAISAFGAANIKSAAAVASDICDDVLALCDYCALQAEMLLEQVEDADREDVLRTIDSISDLADIATRTKRIAEVASRRTGTTRIHPAIRGALRDLARRVKAQEVRGVRLPAAHINRAS